MVLWFRYRWLRGDGGPAGEIRTARTARECGSSGVAGPIRGYLGVTMPVERMPAERAASLISDISETVTRAVEETPVTDVHTHLYPPGFGSLLLRGVDELLTYHYLVAEVMRVVDLSYDRFWALSKREQANLIWQALFLERSPVSEACRGVVTTLARLVRSDHRQAAGDPVRTGPVSRDLDYYRAALAGLSAQEHVDRVFALANVRRVVMTNDPFDPVEREFWLAGTDRDPRFLAALRLDPLLVAWPAAASQLLAWGYKVETSLGGRTVSEVRRFLEEWIARLDPVYLAVSLGPDFVYPGASTAEPAEEAVIRARLIDEVVLPVAREHGLPFALMIGVKRQVNPALRLAGDGVGRACVEAVEHLCKAHPENKFMVTMLSRENQHELAVAARKFRNLMPFGCWWFLNNPSLITEITRFRLELLGTSFIPQHSDARVLDQLIYKWAHSRSLIAQALTRQYELLVESGWVPTREEIERDVKALMGGNFWTFLGRGEP